MSNDVEVSTTSLTLSPSSDIELTGPTTITVEDNPDIVVTMQKKDYSIVGDALYATVSGDTPAWLSALIDSVINNSLTGSLSSLSDLKTAILSALDEIEVAKNSYQELINIEEVVDGIVTSKLTTLNANYETANANIIELQTTVATKEEAAAIAVEQINSSFLTEGGLIYSTINDLKVSVNNINVSYAYTVEQLEADFAGYTGALSEVENLVTATADKVEASWSYNSLLKIGDSYYRAGYGLNTTGTATSGGGTEGDPFNSEFWINAERFRFVNATGDGNEITPFTIDTSNGAAEITFNGNVIIGNPETAIPGGFPSYKGEYGYTDGFTLPAVAYTGVEPLVSDTSGTPVAAVERALLLHFEDTYVDSSGNSVSVTAVNLSAGAGVSIGTNSTTIYSKFGSNALTFTAVQTFPSNNYPKTLGIGYLTGLLPSQINTQDFTVDFWVNPTILVNDLTYWAEPDSSNPTIGTTIPITREYDTYFSLGTYATEGFIAIRRAGTTTALELVVYTNGAFHTILTGVGNVAIDTYSHVVLQRSGITYSVCVNGEVVGWADFTGFSLTSRTFYIGGDSSSTTEKARFFLGLMDEVCVRVGAALFLGSYTVPNSDYTSIAELEKGLFENGVSLLLHCDTVSLEDSSGNDYSKPATIPADKVTIENVTGIFSPTTTAIALDESTSPIEVLVDPITTKDFVLDLWVIPEIGTETTTAASSIANYRIAQIGYVGNNNGVTLGRVGSTSSLALGFLSSSGTENVITSPTGALVDGIPLHILLKKVGDVFSLYTNGSIVGTYTAIDKTVDSSVLLLGSDGVSPFIGNMEEIRLIVGGSVNTYTSNVPDGTVIGDTYKNTYDGNIYTWNGVDWILATGTSGERGAGTYSVGNTTGIWSDAVALTALPDGIAVTGDTVTIYNTSDLTDAVTKRFTGSIWDTPALVVHGDMILNGSLSIAAFDETELGQRLAPTSIATGTESVYSGGIPTDTLCHFYKVGGLWYSGAGYSGVLRRYAVSNPLLDIEFLITPTEAQGFVEAEWPKETTNLTASCWITGVAHTGSVSGSPFLITCKSSVERYLDMAGGVFTKILVTVPLPSDIDGTITAIQITDIQWVLLGQK